MKALIEPETFVLDKAMEAILKLLETHQKAITAVRNNVVLASLCPLLAAEP
jgi:hypothetical protein